MPQRIATQLVSCCRRVEMRAVGLFIAAIGLLCDAAGWHGSLPPSGGRHVTAVPLACATVHVGAVLHAAAAAYHWADWAAARSTPGSAAPRLLDAGATSSGAPSSSSSRVWQRFCKLVLFPACCAGAELIAMIATACEGLCFEGFVAIVHCVYTANIQAYALALHCIDGPPPKDRQKTPIQEEVLGVWGEILDDMKDAGARLPLRYHPLFLPSQAAATLLPSLSIVLVAGAFTFCPRLFHAAPFVGLSIAAILFIVACCVLYEAAAYSGTERLADHGRLVMGTARCILLGLWGCATLSLPSSLREAHTWACHLSWSLSGWVIDEIARRPHFWAVTLLLWGPVSASYRSYDVIFERVLTAAFQRSCIGFVQPPVSDLPSRYSAAGMTSSSAARIARLAVVHRASAGIRSGRAWLGTALLRWLSQQMGVDCGFVALSGALGKRTAAVRAAIVTTLRRSPGIIMPVDLRNTGCADRSQFIALTANWTIMATGAHLEAAARFYHRPIQVLETRHHSHQRARERWYGLTQQGAPVGVELDTAAAPQHFTRPLPTGTVRRKQVSRTFLLPADRAWGAGKLRGIAAAAALRLAISLSAFPPPPSTWEGAPVVDSPSTCSMFAALYRNSTTTAEVGTFDECCGRLVRKVYPSSSSSSAFNHIDVGWDATLMTPSEQDVRFVMNEWALHGMHRWLADFSLAEGDIATRWDGNQNLVRRACHYMSAESTSRESQQLAADIWRDPAKRTAIRVLVYKWNGAPREQELGSNSIIVTASGGAYSTAHRTTTYDISA